MKCAQFGKIGQSHMTSKINFYHFSLSYFVETIKATSLCIISRVKIDEDKNYEKQILGGGLRMLCNASIS